jgi:hypothetical protein
LWHFIDQLGHGIQTCLCRNKGVSLPPEINIIIIRRMHNIKIGLGQEHELQAKGRFKRAQATRTWSMAEERV